MDETLRVQPAMVSRKLLVLAFIRAYIDRWGGSPSMAEIAEGTRSSRDMVKKALRKLEAENEIVRRPGARGIMLPDQLADALRKLRNAGFVIDEDVVRPPPPVAVLDYRPD